MVFANSSGVDEVRKGIPKSRELFEALNEDVLQKVKKTKLPFYVYDETLQIGPDFATRFTTAIQSVFSKGFDKIITVGNDTPHLTVDTLWRAYQNLNEGKTVVGPSLDGGVYLLGFQKNRFDAKQFRSLPWQKRNLFTELFKSFLRRGMLHQLPRLADIDSSEDLQPIIDSEHEISTSLTSILLRAIRKTLRPEKRHSFSILKVYRNSQYNKGSPLFHG